MFTFSWCAPTISKCFGLFLMLLISKRSLLILHKYKTTWIFSANQVHKQDGNMETTFTFELIATITLNQIHKPWRKNYLCFLKENPLIQSCGFSYPLLRHSDLYFYFEFHDRLISHCLVIFDLHLLKLVLFWIILSYRLIILTFIAIT